MKADKFLKNILKYCIPSIVSALLSIIVIPIISRVYPTEEYGKINMFYSMGNILFNVFFLGLDSAYIRFYFEPQGEVKRKDIFGASFWGCLLINVIFSIIVIAFIAQPVSEFLFGDNEKTVLLLLSIYTFSLSIIRLLSIEKRMDGKALFYNIQQIILIVSNRIIYLVAAFFSKDYKVAVLLITFETVLMAIVYVVIQKDVSDFAIPRISLPDWKNLLAFSIPFMPTTLMTWLNNSAGKLVFSGYGAFDELGIYTIATSVANVFAIVPAAFGVYWSPFIYKNYKQEQEFIKKVHNAIMILSIGLVVIFFCVQDIFYLMVGESYRSSQYYFMLIMLSPVQSIICETTSYGIIFGNKTKYNLYISVAATFINVGIGWLLYPHVGAMGIALGIAIAALFQLSVKTFLGQKFYKSIVDARQTIYGIMIISLVTLANSWLYDKLIIRILLSILIMLVTCIVYKDELNSLNFMIKRMREK